MPLTATIAPAASASVAARRPPEITRPPASRVWSDGPQIGHAFGWAWKRRLPGSSYSARQAGHISNPDIVVYGRSYGTPRTIVKRGPQFVQLMNGYRKRRS